MRRVTLMLATVWAASAVPVQVQAQTSSRWEVGVNGARVTYDSLSALNAPSAHGLLEWRGDAWLGRLSAGATGFQNAGWTGHGGGDLTGWITPSADAPLHVELAGSGAWSRHSSGFDSYLMRGDTRLHWMGPGIGGWAGLGAARSRNSSDVSTVHSAIPSAGLWARFGPSRLTFTYQRPTLFEERVHEFSSALVISAGDVDLTVFGGWRDVPAGEGGGDTRWGGATSSIWLGESVALALSGGRYGGDVLQGLPGSNFLSVGLRLTNRRLRPVPESARAPMLFASESAAAGTIGFRIDGARSVEVAGDWNGWRPEPLRRAPDGRWLLPAGLAPGIYRFNLRIDGMRWIVPDGVPASDDGFGGQVGILIVSDGS